MTGMAGHDPGISGHVRPESLVTLLRNTHLDAFLALWERRPRRDEASQTTTHRPGGGAPTGGNLADHHPSPRGRGSHRGKPRRPPPIAPGAGLPQNAGHPLFNWGQIPIVFGLVLFWLLCGSDALVAMKPRRPPPIAPGVGLLQNAGQPLHGQKQAFPCGSDALVAMKPCRPPPIAHGAGLHICVRGGVMKDWKKSANICVFVQ